MNSHSSPSSADTEDLNVVAIWLRHDPIRWVAGAMAGLLACAVMLAFAMVLASMSGVEIWFPVKIAAIPFLGNSAMEIGNMQGVLVGFAMHAVLAAFSGIVYAQATGTNNLAALLGVGLVWGIFSWIFIFNLFIQAFTQVFAAHLSAGMAFPVFLVFGLSLTSVAFFDRALRGGRNP